jgi:hypothetical protein
MRSVRLAGTCAPEVLQSTAAMIEEVKKNGPLVRPIKANGSVVNFSGQRRAL